jgi:hypothetical protein
MRCVIAKDKWQINDFGQRRRIDWCSAQRGFKVINRWSGNTAHRQVMSRPNQHDAFDPLYSAAKRREGGGSNAAGIDIAGMRRDHCLGHHGLKRSRIGQKALNLNA